LAIIPLSSSIVLIVSDGSLDSSRSMVTSPLLMIVSSLLEGSNLNNDPLHFVGSCPPPPSYGNLGKPSYKYIVHSSSNNFMVHEDSAISIPLVKDVVSKETIYITTDMICQFIGLCKFLFNLHTWISDCWKPKIKGNVFIFPCAKGLFILMFDNSHFRDLILKSGP
jgi:hypothetical protein